MLATGIIGGLVSSASTTAAAATMAMHGKISAALAGSTTVLTSLASAAVNLPIIWRTTKKQSRHQIFRTSDGNSHPYGNRRRDLRPHVPIIGNIVKALSPSSLFFLALHNSFLSAAKLGYSLAG